MDSSLLAPGRNFVESAVELKIAVSEADQNYLRALPAGVQESLRSALYTAVNRQPRTPVQIVWTPALYATLAVWDVAGTASSKGRMSLVISTPPPAS